MNEREALAEQFERQRPYLRAIAYRTLGSLSEAEDAVQDAWLRLSQSDSGTVLDLRAWLTTVTARLALNRLRARKSHREEPLTVHVPDPVVTAAEGSHPEKSVLLADSVGLALLVVLETLAPAERLAFVLHDMFAVPFEEIAPLIDRTPVAARKLASRARQRVREQSQLPKRDPARQRAVVDAYFAAAHDRDFERLLTLLHPEVVLRCDGGRHRARLSSLVRGAKAVSGRAIAFARLALPREPAIVNGAAGVVVLSEGVPFSIMGFTIGDSRITEIDILADPERLLGLDLSFLDLSRAG